MFFYREIKDGRRAPPKTPPTHHSLINRCSHCTTYPRHNTSIRISSLLRTSKDCRHSWQKPLHRVYNDTSSKPKQRSSTPRTRHALNPFPTILLRSRIIRHLRSIAPMINPRSLRTVPSRHCTPRRTKSSISIILQINLRLRSLV